MDKAILKKPTKIAFKSLNDPNNGNMSHRRRSNVAEDTSAVFVEELKLGEQFSLALTNKGTVYSWGLNDKGQLGLGNETSTLDPQPITSIGKPVIKIDCGLKHCLALTKDYVLYVWGSNL